MDYDQLVMYRLANEEPNAPYYIHFKTILSAIVAYLVLFSCVHILVPCYPIVMFYLSIIVIYRNVFFV